MLDADSYTIGRQSIWENGQVDRHYWQYLFDYDRSSGR
jgi:hypothetical protein